MSKVKLTYNDKEYVLEYDRQSVKTMEGNDFVLEELTKKPGTMLPLLFQGAFIKHHRGIKRRLIDEIFENLTDKTGLIGVLAEAYAETLSTLVDSTGEGNAIWAVEK